MYRETDDLRTLIRGMRDAYSRGDNAMAFAREQSGGEPIGSNANRL